MIRRLLLVLGLVLLLSACSAAPVADPAAASTKQVAPPVTQPSASLGLARADWEARQGKPTRDAEIFADYSAGKFSASFMGGRLWYLERHWGDRAPVTVDAARAEGKGLAPTDAVLVKSYTSGKGQSVDLYKSAWLASQMTGDTWTGGEPGNFIVIYRTNAAGKVFTIVAATGNNP